MFLLQKSLKYWKCFTYRPEIAYKWDMKDIFMVSDTDSYTVILRLQHRIC